MIPKFFHGDRVFIIPLKDVRGMPARVTDVHNYRTYVEYDVRWFVDSKPVTARVFEDELEAHK